jgi:hypothetical protein
MLRLLADQAALGDPAGPPPGGDRALNRELKKHVVAVESDLKTARPGALRSRPATTAGGLVGSSEPMRAVRRLLERAAPSKSRRARQRQRAALARNSPRAPCMSCRPARKGHSCPRAARRCHRA